MVATPCHLKTTGLGSFFWSLPGPHFGAAMMLWLPLLAERHRYSVLDNEREKELCKKDFESSSWPAVH